jgi:DNA-directed RNA polymerase sigma subunit (sigma70/sigma32)
MFNYLDYDNERYKVRARFIKEMNKKTTLEDVGRILDKFIIDEQAKDIEFLDLRRIKKVEDLNTDGHKD